MLASQNRLARLRRLLAALRADAALFLHPPNLLYLTGFRGSSGLLLVTPHDAIFLTDGRYRTQAAAEVRGVRVLVPAGDLLASAARLLPRGCRRLGIEAQQVSWAQAGGLRRLFGARLELVPAGAEVEKLRQVKDAGEVEKIRAALGLAARVFEEVLPYVRPGARELELAAEIDYRMKQHGARGPAFETIVASGPRSALPHGRASSRRLRPNELVLFDFGAILDDYHSDLSRTVFLGAPPPQVRRIYQAVQDAQAAALDSLAAGVPAGRVDAAARGLLERRGLARWFSHSIGHGVGLEIHEGPRLARGGKDLLEEGNVVTVEPGVYVPGWGGIRIEDVALVRRRGAEVLTPLSRELIAL